MAGSDMLSHDRPTNGDGDGDLRELAGLATVAALAFLAARVVPGGFVVALVGGVPIARAGQRQGLRAGFATGIAGLIETIAVMGPARLIIPLPHVLSGPILGVLYARRARFAALAAAGAAVRLALYLASFAFYVYVVVGADAFLGTYEQVRETLGGWLPAGAGGAVLGVVVFNAVWSLIAGAIQAWVVTRGLSRWQEPGEAVAPVAVVPEESGAPRLDGRAVIGAAAIAFVALLATTRPAVLAVVVVWLVAVWVIARAEPRALLTGLGLAVPLAISTLGFGLVGGLGLTVVLPRTLRVSLIVFTAVWLRAAAGPAGIRDTSMRAMRRLQWAPTLALSSAVLGESAGAGDFGGAIRRLGKGLAATGRRPREVTHATLDWVAEESDRLHDRSGGEGEVRWGLRETIVVLAAVTMAVVVLVTILG